MAELLAHECHSTLPSLVSKINLMPLRHWITRSPFLASGTFSFLDYLLLLFFKLEELYLLQNKNLLSDIFSCCIFLSLISHKLINPWTEVEMHLIICSHRIYWSELSSLLSGTSCVVVIDSLISRKKTLGKCHIKLNFSGSFFLYPFFISAMPVWPHQQYLPGVFGLWYQESMRNSAKHSS